MTDECVLQTSEIDVWKTENTLDQALTTLEALDKQPASIPSFNSDMVQLEDKFHDWVYQKLGSKLPSVQSSVTSAQKRMYAGVVKLAEWVLEEPFDASIPIQPPSMHILQRVILESQRLVHCICASFRWLQKEQALKHGRDVTGVTSPKRQHSTQTLSEVSIHALFV